MIHGLKILTNGLKYSQEIRENRMEEIEDELADISQIMQFKQKRFSQAESAKKYSMCEQLTVEMRELKDKTRTRIGEATVCEES